MRERTERLGGRFDIRSTPGTGTELLVEVPVRSAAAEKLGIVLELMNDCGKDSGFWWWMTTRSCGWGSRRSSTRSRT